MFRFIWIYSMNKLEKLKKNYKNYPWSTPPQLSRSCGMGYLMGYLLTRNLSYLITKTRLRRSCILENRYTFSESVIESGLFSHDVKLVISTEGWVTSSMPMFTVISYFSFLISH